jgi:hypothetical protein
MNKKGEHNFLIKNRRGQGLSTNAIVLIILAVVVLLILILGFTLGWDQLAPWLSSNNVDDVVRACNVACSTGATYDYCTKQMTLKADDLPTGEKEVKGNCNFFATDSEYAMYRIGDCPSITCTE